MHYTYYQKPNLLHIYLPTALVKFVKDNNESLVLTRLLTLDANRGVYLYVYLRHRSSHTTEPILIRFNFGLKGDLIVSFL